MPAGEPESGFAAVISVNHCQSGSSPDYSTEPVVEPRKATVSYVRTGALVNDPEFSCKEGVGWSIVDCQQVHRYVAVGMRGGKVAFAAGIYQRSERDRSKVAIRPGIGDGE